MNLFRLFQLLLLVFTLLSVSQARKPHKGNNLRVHPPASPRPASEKRVIAFKNDLYSALRVFGLKEMAQKALTSHGVQLATDPAHKIHSVATGRGAGLEVTFEADIWDVHGKPHKSSFCVSHQSRHRLMKLERYSLSKQECLKGESLENCLKREAQEKSKSQNTTKVQA